MAWIHLNNFEKDQTRIIPVKFGQNPISGLRGMSFEGIVYGQTDAHMADNRQNVIKKAHLVTM